MTENSVDLKQLIYLINSKKDMNANLILDEGCIIETEDAKPLIKIINYIVNYLHQLTGKELEIGLDLQSDAYLMNFMAFTDKTDLPEISSNLDDALQIYNAKKEVIFKEGELVRIVLKFSKNRAL